MNPPCPLCLGTAAALYYSGEQRHFFRCPACTLVWLDPAQRLSPEDERERYTYHNNAAYDPLFAPRAELLERPM